MIKIPKKIRIRNLIVDIILDKELAGGQVWLGSTNYIKIGLANCEKDPEYILEVLLHEISEAAHIISRTRYLDTSVEGNYKFFMDHKEFENHNAILADCVAQIMQYNKVY